MNKIMYLFYIIYLLYIIFIVTVINAVKIFPVGKIFVLLNSIILLNGIHNVSANVQNENSNVCKTLLDYSTILVNPNCWYNPDVGATTEEIVRRHGYPFESHRIVSEDRYILNIFRIAHGKNNGNSSYQRPRSPVFLQHGIGLTSNVWVNLPKKSLAFKLADLGYDVWLGNARGSEYSLDHETLNRKSQEYWDFSFHEMGQYDIPAIMNYISAETGGLKKIVYIGYSMGTSISYVYASLKPEHAHKYLAGIISLAPVAYMTQVKSSATLLVQFRDQLQDILKKFGKHYWGPEGSRDYIHPCILFPLMEICKFLHFTLFGFDFEEYEAEDIPIFVVNFQSTASTKTALHYGQEIDDKGRFQFFYYDPLENIRRYGMPHPPVYDLKKIRVPVHLFHGTRDYMAGLKDVSLLHNTLTTNKSLTTVVNKMGKGFNHLDFILAKSVHTSLHLALFEVLETLSSSKS